MKELVERVNVREHYTDRSVRNEHGWKSDTVIPVSNDPKDKGLYIITTYDEFFRADLDRCKNGTVASK